MKIILWRYYISLGHLWKFEFDDVVETAKTYRCKTEDGESRVLMKANDGVADIHDRTNYPYIDFYSTGDSSRKFAVEQIYKFFITKWGLYY